MFLLLLSYPFVCVCVCVCVCMCVCACVCMCVCVGYIFVRGFSLSAALCASGIISNISVKQAVILNLILALSLDMYKFSRSDVQQKILCGLSDPVPIQP